MSRRMHTPPVRGKRTRSGASSWPACMRRTTRQPPPAGPRWTPAGAGIWTSSSSGHIYRWRQHIPASGQPLSLQTYRRHQKVITKCNNSVRIVVLCQASAGERCPLHRLQRGHQRGHRQHQHHQWHAHRSAAQQLTLASIYKVSTVQCTRHPSPRWGWSHSTSTRTTSTPTPTPPTRGRPGSKGSISITKYLELLQSWPSEKDPFWEWLETR